MDAGEDAGAEVGRRAASGEPLPPPCRPANVAALLALAATALARQERERSGGERRQLVVHVDAAVLCDDRAGRCELADGPALAPETPRRLGCDASLLALIEREGEPLALGRRTRSVPPALRRALTVRDSRFPGCRNERFLDAHHIEHWARGGETSLDNLLLLCRRQHRLVHEGGCGNERDGDGELRFRDPAGSRSPRCSALLPPLPGTCARATVASAWRSMPARARAASTSGWISGWPSIRCSASSGSEAPAP